MAIITVSKRTIKALRSFGLFVMGAFIILFTVLMPRFFSTGQPYYGVSGQDVARADVPSSDQPTVDTVDTSSSCGDSCGDCCGDAGDGGDDGDDDG